MNAPLARHLTRFASDPLPEAPMTRVAPVASAPMLTLGIDELEARLAAARDEVSAALSTAHRDETIVLASEHEAALGRARAEWCAVEAAGIAACVEGAFAELRRDLAERIARVLRPLLAETVVERATSALCETLDRLLADPGRPPITVRGPADVIAAIRARAPDLAVNLVVAETAEAIVVADGTRIETRLVAALSVLADTEL